MKRSLACLIPCFNESKNLEILCKEINFNNNKNIDWYIINNGSTDANNLEFQNIIKKYITIKNFYIFNIKKNIGYGFGIKNCINKISKKYDLICWTHADGQTPISDVVRAYKIYLSKPNLDFVKGIRISRKDGIVATLFTAVLNIILKILLNGKSLSPNSQPTLIDSKYANSILKHTENDGNYDVSVMYLANKLSLRTLRYPVQFKKRFSGEGANETFKQKLSYSIKILEYLLKKNFLPNKED